MALNDITSNLLGIAGNGVIIIAILIFVAIAGVVTFYLLKRSRLKYNVIEETDIGNGRIATFHTKAGWFGTRNILFGLLDIGKEKVMKTKEGKYIMGASTADMHLINGKLGFICRRKHDDARVLVAIDKFHLTEEGNNVLENIAPARLRGEAVELVKEAERETRGTWEQVAPYVAMGLIVIIFIVGLIFITQSLDKSTQSIAQMTTDFSSNIANACAKLNTAPSLAP